MADFSGKFACIILTSQLSWFVRREGDTKQKLFNTAVDLIWENSYGSISVDDICNRAGVNKGSFYYAFKSKSELAVAAFENHWNKKRPLLDEVFSSQIPAARAHGKLLRSGCSGSIGKIPKGREGVWLPFLFHRVRA